MGLFKKVRKTIIFSTLVAMNMAILSPRGPEFLTETPMLTKKEDGTEAETTKSAIETAQPILKSHEFYKTSLDSITEALNDIDDEVGSSL